MSTVSFSHPATSREVKLASRPSSLPQAGHFTVADVAFPVVGPDEVLVRNRYSRLSASLRMMISEGAEAVQGVPFPALQPGDTLAEETLGQVLTAPEGSRLRPGDWVRHVLGLREYASVPTAGCSLLDEALPDVVAHLSHGWTAYAALTRGVQLRPDDTVLVTSAAGAIGTMAGQVARLLGAGRVIGTTGSPAKAERLVRELGYDAAVLRGHGGEGVQLRAAAPQGVDVILDNVGGESLRAVLEAARPGARALIVGALSGQLARDGTGRTAPVTLDSFQILLKKLTLRGYSADDDPDTRAEWDARFGPWLRSGAIAFPHVVIDGIEQAPAAIEALAAGLYFGTVVLKL